MRIGFFGDVVGRSGREGIAEHLPGLRRQLQLDSLAEEHRADDAEVVPAVPAGQAAQDRAVRAGVEGRIARDERLRDERGCDDEDARDREHGDDRRIEP